MNQSTTRPVDHSPTCDLFCAVVDNLGDAGVSWRLALALSRRGWRVRLWIDDPAPLARLAPGALPDQCWQGVTVERWRQPFPADVVAADIVIEAFACQLPQEYLAAMLAQPIAPLWLNLEYLSAEDWVAGCHGLPSPHPKLPLSKYFFFPGFTADTGGLLGDFTAPPCSPQPDQTLTISLFCYPNRRLPALLDIWAASDTPIHCRVASGLPTQQVASWLGQPLAAGERCRRGALTLEALPFLPQNEYDTLLASCALNFVRGEDSFVRAQWAGRPLIWQAYPQAEGAHFAKLSAFAERYSVDLTQTTAITWRDFLLAWNDADHLLDWPALRAALPALDAHAAQWPKRLRQAGDLADKLVSFCRARLKSRVFFPQAD